MELTTVRRATLAYPVGAACVVLSTDNVLSLAAGALVTWRYNVRFRGFVPISQNNLVIQS